MFLVAKVKLTDLLDCLSGKYQFILSFILIDSNEAVTEKSWIGTGL